MSRQSLQTVTTFAAIIDEFASMKARRVHL